MNLTRYLRKCSAPLNKILLFFFFFATFPILQRGLHFLLSRSCGFITRKHDGDVFTFNHFSNYPRYTIHSQNFLPVRLDGYSVFQGSTADFSEVRVEAEKETPLLCFGSFLGAALSASGQAVHCV